MALQFENRRSPVFARWPVRSMCPLRIPRPVRRANRFADLPVDCSEVRSRQNSNLDKRRNLDRRRRPTATQAKRSVQSGGDSDTADFLKIANEAHGPSPLSSARAAEVRSASALLLGKENDFYKVCPR